MLARVIRYLVTGATILGGIYGLIWYGGVLVSERYQVETQHLRANLEREHTDLETTRSQLDKAQGQTRRLQSTVQELEEDRDQLQRMVEENAKLRSELARLQDDLETTRSQLDKAQGQTRRLQSAIQGFEKNRDQLQRMVEERLALLRVTVDDSEAPGKFVVLVENPSQSVIRIIQNRIQSWLDGQPGNTYNTSTLTLPPGNTNNFATLTASGNLTLLRQGKSDYRAAVCLVYETVSDIDRRRWLTEHWFWYKPKSDCSNKHCVSFRKQDNRILKSPYDGCDLKRLMPPGWLDIKK